MQTTTTTGDKTPVTGGLVDLVHAVRGDVGLDVVHALRGDVGAEMMVVDVLAGAETSGTVQDLINTSDKMRFEKLFFRQK